MKRWLKWLIVVLVLALIAGGILRALSVRKAQQAALAQAATGQAQSVVELGEADLVRATPQALQQGLPISGTVRAVNSAVVKARVAGEVQGLVLREGDAVQAGQVVARIEPSEYAARLRQSQQQADAAKAQIDIAQRQFDNNKALVDQGFISKTALDTSQANLNAARANYNAALAGVDVSNKAVGDTVLRAPISGQLAARLVQPGERVGVDARIVEIVDVNKLELEATLAANDAFDVRVGQRATLQLEGGGSPRSVAATVVRINPSVQAGSRSVLVYLGLEKSEGLRQGIFAQGTLATGSSTALAVPVSAVRTDKPQPYLQIAESGRVVHRPVVLGARGESAGESLVAVTGVAEGAVVVRGSVGALREGSLLKLPGKAPAPVASAASATK
jgi:membrane fusion protein, multidrug efflux system